MLSIFKNNWNRMKEQKMYLCVAVGLTICAVIMAVVLTNKMEPKLNLAVVGGQQAITDTKTIKVTHLQKQPGKSELVMNKYDAVVAFDKTGNYKINTIKSEKYKKQLESALKGAPVKTAEDKKIRGIGTNIIGYMLMFLMMQGVLYARLFTEDKEKHVMERIVISPIRFWSYLLGHMVFVWILIFLPSWMILVIMNLLGVSIGFSLWQYAVLIAAAALLSTSFAVCLNSFFNVVDTANMIGTCIVLMTTILSGSFYGMGSGDSLFHKILYIIPQKGLMESAGNWEQHIVNFRGCVWLMYVIICAAVFLGIAVIKTRNDYIYHRSRSHGKGKNAGIICKV